MKRSHKRSYKGKKKMKRSNRKTKRNQKVGGAPDGAAPHDPRSERTHPQHGEWRQEVLNEANQAALEEWMAMNPTAGMEQHQLAAYQARERQRRAEENSRNAWEIPLVPADVYTGPLVPHVMPLSRQAAAALEAPPVRRSSRHPLAAPLPPPTPVRDPLEQLSDVATILYENSDKIPEGLYIKLMNAMKRS